MISPDLRQSFLDRAGSLEGSLRRLVAEIMAKLPEAERLRRRPDIGSKLEVLVVDLERAILYDPERAAGADEIDEELERVQELSDDMIRARAKLAREQRQQMRKREMLELEASRMRLSQLERELDAGLGE